MLNDNEYGYHKPSIALNQYKRGIEREKETKDHTVHEEPGARPASVGGEGESLLVGELVGQVPNHVHEFRGFGSGWDPEGRTGDER